MEIILLRHGKPDIQTDGKIGAAEFGKWVSRYNQAGITAGSEPDCDTIKIAGQCAYVICSNYPRSLESARKLNINRIDLTSPMFRECDIPYIDINFPRLSVKSWTIFFRICQLLGYSARAESYQQIKRRAEECVTRLIASAREHNSVLFVGHGTLIWFIHKLLLRGGWSGPSRPARNHWEFGIYSQ